MTNERNDNALIMMLNGLGVAVAYGLLAVSLWLSVDVPLATKGYWGMGIVLLTLSLINLVKYRFDVRLTNERSRKTDDPNTDMAADLDVSADTR